MVLQEKLLRELLTARANPRLSKAVEAVADGSDPSSLPLQQLLSVLQSLPVTDYSGDIAAGYIALLEAMRAGESPTTLSALAADICKEVSCSC
jgi:hypothetical protein